MEMLERIFSWLDKQFLLYYIISNVGKVCEEKDIIYCYVDNDKIKEKYREFFGYYIEVNGFDNRNISDGIINKCGLNKMICYVFKNFRFDGEVRIRTEFNTRIIFENCIFDGNIKLQNNNIDVVFKKNKYYNSGRFCGFDSKIFLLGVCRNLSFIEDDFVNRVIECNSSCNFGIDVIADKVSISRSNINIGDNEGDICIKSMELIIEDSLIKGSSIYLDCNNLELFGIDTLVITSGIIIESDKRKFNLEKVVSPYIVYNGEVLKYDRNEEMEMANKIIFYRKLFISQLRGISSYFNSINLKKVREVEEKINSRTIRKILKK